MLRDTDASQCSQCDAGREIDPVVRRYRRLLALLDWSSVPERRGQRAWPGSPPHPARAYVKALLVKLCEDKPYITQLRTFLVEHPLLVLELGFAPVLDPTVPYGFNIDRTVPGDRWLRHQQATLDPAMLQALLASTVAVLQEQLPGLGTTVAVDVKHIYAWVRENNPREHMPHRFDAARQPHGDPDCRLGAKRLANQDGPPGTRAPAKEFLWGYMTGVLTAIDPKGGDLVLAELTQPFNHQDITVFHPRYEQATATLGFAPINVAADAAYDAWHVDETCVEPGGMVAVPRNRRGPAPSRDADGHLQCERGVTMTLGSQFDHEDGFRAQRYRCPLLAPTRTGATCEHAQFIKGPGGTKYINIEVGGQIRANLDRTTETYKAIYRQRTSTERVNSQAKALGIERPHVRRMASVSRLNTLTYILINLRALQRLQARPQPTPPSPSLC